VVNACHPIPNLICVDALLEEVTHYFLLDLTKVAMRGTYETPFHEVLPGQISVV
jgi:hypothetical protein